VCGAEDHPEHADLRQPDDEFKRLFRIGDELGWQLASEGHRLRLAAGSHHLVDPRSPLNSEVPEKLVILDQQDANRA
jgi:hypothetical protein